jgi:hypothetical protein
MEDSWWTTAPGTLLATIAGPFDPASVGSFMHPQTPAGLPPGLQQMSQMNAAMAAGTPYVVTMGALAAADAAAAAKALLGRLRPPDFYTGSFGFNSPYGLGITFSATVTRDWDVYLGVGPTIGVPGPGISGNLGWLLQGSQPTSGQIGSFVHGWSVGVSGFLPLLGLAGPAVGGEMGDPLGGRQSWKDSSNYAFEPGIALGTCKAAQMQATYSFGPFPMITNMGDAPYIIKDDFERFFGQSFFGGNDMRNELFPTDLY